MNLKNKIFRSVRCGIQFFKNKILILYSEKRLLLFMIILFFLIYCFRSLTKHIHFESQSWDLGIYDQQAWLYSRFAYPFFNTVRGMFLPSDHFSLSFLLLVPFYWIYPHAGTLLVVQALMVALAAYPLWVIAKHYTKSTLFSFVISILFLTSVGVQSAIDFDFHLATIAVFFISFFIYFFWKRRLIPCLVFGALACLTKEDMPFYIAGIALFFLLFVPLEQKGKKAIKKVLYIFPRSFKKERILAAGIFILSIVSAILILQLIMPHLPSQGKADYFSFRYLGNNYTEVVKNSVSHPGLIYQQFVNNPLKVKTAEVYLEGYSFLPLLAPHAIFASLPFIMTKFISDRGAQWGLNGQYGVVGVLELAFATIITMSYIVYFFPKKHKIIVPVISIIILAVGLFNNTKKENSWFHLLTKKQTWSKPVQYQNINHLIKLIPGDASVATQDYLLSHVSDRRIIYLYMCPLCSIPDGNPDYILLDSRFGAGFAPPAVSHEVVKKLIESLNKKGNPPWQEDGANYRLIEQDGTAYLFKNEMNQ